MSPAPEQAGPHNIPWTALSTELSSTARAAAPGHPASRASSGRPHQPGTTDTTDLVTAVYLQGGDVYAVVTRTSVVGYNIQQGED